MGAKIALINALTRPGERGSQGCQRRWRSARGHPNHAGTAKTAEAIEYQRKSPALDRVRALCQVIDGSRGAATMKSQCQMQPRGGDRLAAESGTRGVSGNRIGRCP